MDTNSIPVMVDDRKDIDDFKMTRATYFHIEAIEPTSDILIDHSCFSLPVLYLEFSGVVQKPIGDNEYFETPDMIEELFQTVESYESLYVDSDNLWIPNNLFDKTPERGDVYRMPFDLFVKLYSLCRDDASLDANISRFNGKDIIIKFSEIETVAFSQWTEQIIEDVKEVYPKNKSLELEWR